jgi:hypothetical protein
MKSTETYKIIREVVAPGFKANGFKRAKPGALNWIKPLSETTLDSTKPEFFLIWFQILSSGYDPPLGCSFTMDFQISALTTPGAWGVGCVTTRLPNVLTDGELERVRIMQNQVRERLHKPNADHWIYQKKYGDSEHYLSQFDQILAWTHPNYKNMLWFQYQDAADVVTWAEFILELLPTAIERVQQLPRYT